MITEGEDKVVPEGNTDEKREREKIQKPWLWWSPAAALENILCDKILSFLLSLYVLPAALMVGFCPAARGLTNPTM